MKSNTLEEILYSLNKSQGKVLNKISKIID